MGCYSDPTANMALGNINREFTRLEKKAKNLSRLYAKGKITPAELEQARAQFKGIYKGILDRALEKR